MSISECKILLMNGGSVCYAKSKKPAFAQSYTGASCMKTERQARKLINCTTKQPFGKRTTFYYALPPGKAGNGFIVELTRLINLFNVKTHLERHAISLSLIFDMFDDTKATHELQSKRNSMQQIFKKPPCSMERSRH